MAEAAREWAKRLEEGGWPAIERLVAQKAPETLHFEAKSKEYPKDPLLSVTDRKNLSKALSGFANSDGGVLVWGLNARPGPDRVDRVQDFARIGDLEGFVASLEAEPVDAVSPPVDGLDFIAIEDPDAPGTGVVVCVVPASDGGPHMAIGRKLHRYYRRDAGDFRPMQHFEVADMFGRRPRPIPEPRMTWGVILQGTANRLEARLSVEHFLRNGGRGPAAHPALTVGYPSAGWTTEGSHPHRSFVSANPPVGLRIRVLSGADIVFYPGDEILVLRDKFVLERTPSGRPVPFSITSTGHSLWAEARETVLELTPEELDEAANEAFDAKPRPPGGGWGW